MIDGNLDTTNALLAVMAAVAVLEAVVLVAGGILAYRMYAAAMRKIDELEQRHVVPLVARVDGLMMRLEPVIERANGLLETVEKVEQTTGRVTQSVASRVNTFVGVVNGARHVLNGFFNGRRSSSEAPEHAEAGTGTVR